MKINLKKISLQQFLPLPEAEIQGLLHPAEVNLGYLLPWFQSLQLPSTQSESPLAPKSHVSFIKYVLNCEQNCSYSDQDYLISGLVRVYCKRVKSIIEMYG
jgi:hypothetical protein